MPTVCSDTSFPTSVMSDDDVTSIPAEKYSISHDGAPTGLWNCEYVAYFWATLTERVDQASSGSMTTEGSSTTTSGMSSHSAGRVFDPVIVSPSTQTHVLAVISIRSTTTAPAPKRSIRTIDWSVPVSVTAIVPSPR